MAKFPEAMARLFRNVYVCRRCKTKVRTVPKKILDGRVKCRRCNGKAFRAIKKGVKKA